jgi:hypothetical protein
VTIRIDEKGRGHVEPRIHRGSTVAIGLVVLIAITALVAWTIHVQNIRARDQARRAAEAAEAAEDGGATGSTSGTLPR